MTIPLGPPLPAGSGGQPGSLGRKNPGARTPRDPYLALLLAGLAVPPTSPPARWALTPPFHPYPSAETGGRSDLCGAFPRVAPGGRYPPPCLPGVRTFLDLAAAAIRPSARPPSRPEPRRGQREGAPRRSPGPRQHPRRPVPRPPWGESATEKPPVPRSSHPRARGSRCARRRRAKRRPIGGGGQDRDRPDRSPAQRQAPPVELRSRIGLAPRRDIGMGDHAGGRNAPAPAQRVEQSLQRRHLSFGKRWKPVERPGIAQLDADRPRIHVRNPAPTPGPRVPRPFSFGDQPPDPPVLGDHIMRRNHGGGIAKPLDGGLGGRHRGIMDHHQIGRSIAAPGTVVRA